VALSPVPETLPFSQSLSTLSFCAILFFSQNPVHPVHPVKNSLRVAVSYFKNSAFWARLCPTFVFLSAIASFSAEALAKGEATADRYLL